MLRPFEPAAALTLIGKRGQVHPNDVVAFEADVADVSPVVRGGGTAPRLGSKAVGETWVSVYDTRNLYTDGRLTTDPASPDTAPILYAPGYPMRPEPVDVKSAVSALQVSVQTAQEAAAVAQARADNARQMVLNDRPKISTLEQVTADLTTLSQSYQAALPASVADRAALHQTDADHAALITTLTQQNAQQDTAVAAERTKNTQQDASLATLNNNATSVQAAQLSLTNRITALEARSIISTGSTAMAGTLLGGATTDVVVIISPAQPDTAYNPFPSLGGVAGLLGQAAVQGVVSKTTTTVTVRVKNTGLTSLLTTGGTVYVIATR